MNAMINTVTEFSIMNEAVRSLTHCEQPVERIYLLNAEELGQEHISPDHLNFVVIVKTVFGESGTRWNAIRRFDEAIAFLPVSKDVFVYSFNEWASEEDPVLDEARIKGDLIYDRASTTA